MRFSIKTFVGEHQMTKPSINITKSGSLDHLTITAPTFHSLFWNFPKKVQNYLESHFKTSKKDDDGTITAIAGSINKDSSTVLDVNLEKQLQAWKENPVWIDPSPDIKVTVPKGSLSKLNVEVDVGLPPDTVYDIVTDPDNRRVFKNIKEVISRRVLVDEGPRQVVEVEQAALWSFLWWSGTFSVHLIVDQNRADHSMKFRQVKSGFMKRFEGCWRVAPIFIDEKLCDPFKPKILVDYITCTQGKGRIASKVSLEQLIQPSIVPPPPISWYLRGITTRTTETIINDLLAEATRIKGFSRKEDLEAQQILPTENIDEGIVLDDIKGRWAFRRRNAKQSRRRLLRST